MATAAKQQTATVRGSSSSASPTSSSTAVTGQKSKSASPSLLGSPSSPLSGGSSPLKQTKSFLESEEDIATIAKQISDHAEAIYQTWKARGLAPTEILNCHTATSDAFGKALTPPSRHSIDSSPVAEFLAQTPDMSNNNLEKLVSSFVNEDKARQQAARRHSSGATSSILTSGTIKDALRKFENSSTPSGYVKPNFLVRSTSPKATIHSPSNSNVSSNSNSNSGYQKITQISQTQTDDIGNSQNLQKSTTTSTANTNKTSLSKSVPDVLIDTINQSSKQSTRDQSPTTNLYKSNLQKSTSSSTSPSSTLNVGVIGTSSNSNSLGRHNPSISNNTIKSKSISTISSNSALSSTSSGAVTTTTTTTLATSTPTTPSTNAATANTRKPQTPAKPANLINHTPSWPLKARLGISGSIGNSLSSHNSSILKNGEDASGKTTTTKISHKTIELSKNSADLLDEVSREEERLINALKTGIVIENSKSKADEILPEVITSTLNDKKPSWNKSSVTPSPSASASTPSVGKITSTNKNSISSGLTNSGSNSLSGNGISGLIGGSSTSSISKLKISNSINSNSGVSGGGTSGVSSASKSWSTSRIDMSASPMTSSTSNSTTITPSTPSSSSSSSSAVAAVTTATIQQNTMTPPIDIIQPPKSDATSMVGNDALGLAPAPGKFKLRPKNDAAVPHPDPKQNSNNHNNYVSSRTNVINPVRPFLTRGSVAERVLMFEKCPDVKAPFRNINREPPKTVAVRKPRLERPPEEEPIPLPKVKPLSKPAQQTHTTLQRHIRSSTKNVYIPRFHFPHGKPLPTITVDTTLQRLVSAFDSFPNNQVTKEDFHHILKICQLPFYWRMPLMTCAQHATSGLVDGYRFIEFWKAMSVYCHDAASRFVYIVSRGQRSRPYILHEDLVSLVQDVVDTHPGLAFLKEAAEFHSRYVHTVIARIFYSVNRSWSGKITVAELRRSNLLQVIQLLEEEEDINQIMAFFSYEHFYVIYCKFWELDRDHDLFIDQNDLARHNDHALSTRIIERIFSGCVTRGGKARVNGPNGPKMSYTDFVWFLLSEEDKTNTTAIEYWFRCMDLDGDGIISMYELEYFYEEQQQRMESIGIETLPFEDCLCQMLDMIKPIRLGCITLGDLKRCRMTPIFFDTFFNLEKYLEHEQRDPFATQRDNDDMTDWDRYAAQEYELLVAEEGGDTQGSYDEDEEYESNIDILESQMDDMSNMINEW